MTLTREEEITGRLLTACEDDMTADRAIEVAASWIAKLEIERDLWRERHDAIRTMATRLDVDITESRG